MPVIDSAAAVKKAFDYLMKVSPNSASFSNFRLEEISADDKKDFLLTISYELVGEFGFDKQKVYKDFKVKKEGEIEWMKIRKV